MNDVLNDLPNDVLNEQGRLPLVFMLFAVCTFAIVGLACTDDSETDGTTTVTFGLERRWPTDGASAPQWSDCLLASPHAYTSSSGDQEVIQAGGDVVAGLDPITGELLWHVVLPSPEGERAFVAATPALRGHQLIVAYQTYQSSDTTTSLDPGTSAISYASTRLDHFIAVVDLDSRALDTDYPAVRLVASVPASVGEETVDFAADHAFGRSEVLWMGQTDTQPGFAYVTFGNIRDLQPWHGWVFELDLAAWALSSDDAILGVLVTTPESDCGSLNASGSLERICGGGLWAPSGPLGVETGPAGEFDLILAPGNGQLDLARRDYANTLMRTSAGLEFDPQCSADACADFDPDSPANACSESCVDLFIPRPEAGEGPPRPASGLCDDLEFFECWQQFDYIGGSTPAYVTLGDDLRLLAYPTKDGHMYLVDYDHLGTMYDRHQMVEYCGTDDQDCWWSWAGMIVNEPAVTERGGIPLLITPTFMPGPVLAAGVVALTVELDGETPQLIPAWQYPPSDSVEAVTRFRRHPSRPRLHSRSEGDLVWVVDTAGPGGSGILTAIQTSDGVAVAETSLVGPGYRFTQPLVIGDTVYINSCGSDDGPGTLEAYELTIE